jgi:F-type H+-transporting ATPase subunit epsilon
MLLEIVSPESKLYEGEVDLVNLPGSNGTFGILENHAPLISTLKEGTVRFLQRKGGNNKFDEASGRLIHDPKNDEEVSIEIKSGVVEVNNNKVIVLVE